MDARVAAALILGAYLLGSVPFGLTAGLLLKGVDIRKHGSGNIGASNVLRLLGVPAALVVLVLDTLKGFVPVWAAAQYFHMHPAVVVAAGIAAIVGHNYSVFLGFRGGKGVATSLGVLSGIDPLVACLSVAVWAVVVAITRYISVGSIVAGLSVPLMLYFAPHFLPGRSSTPPEYLLLGTVAGLFILVRHRSNIARLRTGTETKIGEKASISSGASDVSH